MLLPTGLENSANRPSSPPPGKKKKKHNSFLSQKWIRREAVERNLLKY